ncbi:Meiotically up-regulated gene 71 protein isoform 5 [Theobroma cacao]|nr:Meiotically up-regulated gene 71 protein isoform 5 [Theobroma cacao]
MYQTVGHQIIVSYAECMGVPLFRRRIQGSTRHQKLSYRTTPGDEVEDMFILLNEVKKQIPSITAVSSGAIASDYQRLRVESVCSRLGLVSLAYLWKQDQSLLLQEMITNGIVAITVKVAAMGLDPAKHLGKEIAFLKPYLHKLKDLYGINVCGEGGEYETLTFDCPLFHNARIMLDESQVVLHSSDSIAPVGVLHPLKFHLERKAKSNSISGNDKSNDLYRENISSVFEVQGENPLECKAPCESVPEASDLVEVSSHRLHLSKTEKADTFSICCWLQDQSEPSAGLQEDLKLILRQIELQLQGYGFGWEHVLYIHLYISDMNQFNLANETYVKFITQDKCPNGVPSRSTIELPLIQAGLGGAYIEVLVANDQSKRVLHVQSISCWAPSCIGPYSQGALVEVKPILYVPETSETTEETLNDLSGVMTPSYFGFQPADWHDSCIQKFVIHGKICAVVLSITGAVALKICSDSMNADWSNGNHRNYLTEGQMKRISRFCIYVLDKFIMENGFSWKDTMSLRFYYPPNLHVPLETLSLLFTDAFKELDQMSGSAKVGGKSIFNLVPVLGAGKSAACTEDIITCELFARKS